MTLAVPDFSSARILVVGDVMLDRYWHGSTLRISPEAPVPVVKVGHCEDRPGGAANVALNIAALGAQVSLLGLVGHDEAADALARALQLPGLANRCIPVDGVTTILKQRVISRNQQLIRLDFEDSIASENMEPLQGAFDSLLADHDIVVLSDYAKGTLTDAQALIRSARKAGKPVVVDPKNPAIEVYRGATLITPNLSEFEEMAGTWASEEEFAGKGLDLVEKMDLEALLVTRSERGMTLLDAKDGAFHLPARAREVFDVTGAGDTVIATIAAGLGAGLRISDAVNLANISAGAVVSKLGTAAITAAELRRHIQREDTQRRILDEEQLLLAIKDAKACGERVVMTNGCFDILHAGHVSYLASAREMGDRLVVAVNDDAAVKALKGADRPVNTLEQRMSVLASLSSVDWVVPFSELDPERLICKMLPDVLVKGADYKLEDIAGGDCVLAAGGEVRTIDLVEGVSTTSIIRAMT